MANLAGTLNKTFKNIDGSTSGTPLPEILGLPPTETGGQFSSATSIKRILESSGLETDVDKLFAGNSESRSLSIAAKNLATSSGTIAKRMFPILEATPCEPEMVGGTNIYTLKEATEKYNAILNYAGFRTNESTIKLAVQADSFPSESFSNEFGESFLERFTSIASSGIAELGYMSGSRSIGDALDQLSGILPEQLAGPLKSAKEAAANKVSAWTTSPNLLQKTLGQAAQTLSTMAMGSRIDFPNVWKNSSYGPSWTFTVRLYNPSPGDKTMTSYYLAGPLAAILALGLPVTEDGGQTYAWPFLLKCKIPGYLDAVASYIQNITVIKGGDQQQIGFNQRLGIVDVRIELGTLYSTLVASSKDMQQDSNRPTLKKYIDVLLEEKDGSLMGNSNDVENSSSSITQLAQTGGRQVDIITKYGKSNLENIADGLNSQSENIA